VKPLPLDPVPVAPSAAAKASATTSTCPNCGQRVDRANIRCPRCRRWFTEPPIHRTWSRLSVAVAMVSLVLAGFAAGVAVQWFWLPLPPGVVVPEESIGED
jgi:predicted amidophosphoribosyltransferase